MQDDDFKASGAPAARPVRRGSGGGLWLALLAFAAGAGVTGCIGPAMPLPE